MIVPKQPPAVPQYYPYIDGLRALAVLSVLIYHLDSSWLPGGFVGVDVFFVISGFVVSASIARFDGRGMWQFLGYFYVRRLQRIAPALIVCLVVTAYLTALFVPASWLSDVNQKTGLYAFFGLSNFVLAQNGRDYFAPFTDFNPYTHTWSLAVEEQFYLIFPFLFVTWLAAGRKRLLSVALFAVALLASLGFGFWQSRVNPTQAYFLIPSRFWELAAGVLLYQVTSGGLIQNSDKRLPVPRGLVGAVSLVVMLAAFVLVSPKHFPVPGVLPTVIGTLGVIWSLHDHPELRRLHGLLGSRPLVFVGRISYSLYLWHWPVFVLFRWTVGLESPTMRALAAALAFLLAVLSWALVENPVRHAHRLRRWPQGAVIAGSLLAVSCAWGGVRTIVGNEQRISLSVLSRNAEVWYPHGPSTSAEHPGCTAEPVRHDVEGIRLLTYTPSGCVNPQTLKSGNLYVIGDSHASAYEGLFKQYAIRSATRIHVYANGGCPFVSLGPSLGSDKIRCDQQDEAVWRDMLKRLKLGDVLFLPSLRLARFSSQWEYLGEEKARRDMLGRRAQLARERASIDAVKRLRELTERGVQIVFEAPKPLFKAPPARCGDWFNRANPICAPGFAMPRQMLEEYRAPIMQAFADITRQLPGSSVWDPFPVLCPEEECNAWRDGLPLFFDGDHISANGNKVLVPSFTAAMDARLGHL